MSIPLGLGAASPTRCQADPGQQAIRAPIDAQVVTGFSSDRLLKIRGAKRSSLVTRERGQTTCLLGLSTGQQRVAVETKPHFVWRIRVVAATVIVDIADRT